MQMPRSSFSSLPFFRVTGDLSTLHQLMKVPNEVQVLRTQLRGEAAKRQRRQESKAQQQIGIVCSDSVCSRLVKCCS